ncbi:MAG: DUF1667 domain-containing protein [Solobacterium sp.]|nr:DUF1667 domain-containing protein [Solobacterium sp.]
MESKELICVNCPMGCRVKVTMDGQNILEITGNQCPRGKAYAEQESICPMRILTTTVTVNHGVHRVLPVITSAEIPLEKMEEAMKAIRNVTVEAPVKVNDVIVKDLIGTGVDVVASRSMNRA